MVCSSASSTSFSAWAAFEISWKGGLRFMVIKMVVKREWYLSFDQDFPLLPIRIKTCAANRSRETTVDCAGD